MKIEEAIDILSDNHTVLYSHGDYTEQEENEALSMAIKSLEAWEKVKEEIKSMPNIIYRWNAVEIIDKYLTKVSE